MGFDINKFQKAYKAMAAENRDLKDRLAHAEQEKAQAVQIATVTARKPLEEEIDRLKHHHLRKDKLMIEGSAVLEATTAQLAARDMELTAANNHIAEIAAHRKRLIQQIQDSDPALRAEQAKVRELQALLESVRDRMRRKDLEKQNAILNRQAMAGVVPDVNRGR